MKATMNIYCVSALAFLSCAVLAEPAADAQYRAAVRELEPAPSVLGAQWARAEGVVMEDVGNVQSLPEPLRPTGEVLKAQLEPLGVLKVADFSYEVPDDPSRLVTLRVFIFDSRGSCEKWWDTKYRRAGWEKSYKAVDGVEYRAIDSTETPKRIVAIENVLMTCHSLKRSDNHLAVLDACVEKVEAGLRKE